MHSMLAVLDTLLIAPFLWPADPLAGYWLGCGVLAALSVGAGFATSALLRRLNHRYLADSGEEALKRQNEALAARRQGDDQAYRAANRLANEAFGRWFFQSATITMAALFPAFLAAGWLSTRFDHVAFPIPFTDTTLSFVAPLVLWLFGLRTLVAVGRHVERGARFTPSRQPRRAHARETTPDPASCTPAHGDAGGASAG